MPYGLERLARKRCLQPGAKHERFFYPIRNEAHHDYRNYDGNALIDEII